MGGITGKALLGQAQKPRPTAGLLVPDKAMVWVGPPFDDSGPRKVAVTIV